MEPLPVPSETPPALGEMMDDGVTLSPPVEPPPPPMMPAEPAGPRIVSISPENGARGVKNDVSIVITFDVPMSQ